MKYRLMDVLACPYDKTFPLRLVVLSENVKDREYTGKVPFCELYCAYKGMNIKDMEDPSKAPCAECYKHEIGEGILYCEKCHRWYPIKEDIPILLPDELRNINDDKEFLSKIKDKLSKIDPKLAEDIINNGNPINLKQG
ncbi:MAG: Trm112 family protein [Thermocladium sp.]